MGDSAQYEVVDPEYEVVDSSPQQSSAAINKISRPRSPRPVAPSSASLSLGQPPSTQPRSIAEGLTTEQQERRSGGPSLSIQPQNAGLYNPHPEQVVATPRPTTRLSRGAQPTVNVEDAPAAPVPSGRFTRPRTTPEEAASDLTFSDPLLRPYRGAAELYRGFRDIAPDPRKPGTYQEQATRGATGILKGATDVASPAMIAGAIAQPELALLAGAGATAGEYGAGKFADIVKTSPDTKELLKQVGGLAGGLAGGVAYGGAKAALSPEDALTDLLWKRGYIKGKDGQTAVFQSAAEARAAAQEVIKQNPSGIVGYAKQKGQYSRLGAEYPEVDEGARAANFAQQRAAQAQVDNDATIHANDVVANQQQPFAPQLPAPPDPAGQIIADHATVMQRAMNVAQGMPPVAPEPPPPAPPKVSALHPEDIDSIAQQIEKAPPEQRAQAILDAHEKLSALLQQQGKIVVDGKLEVTKSPDQADSAAQRIINKKIGDMDKQAADAEKEAAKPAKPETTSEVKGVRANSRAKAAELAKPQYEVVEPENKFEVVEPEGVQSANGATNDSGLHKSDSGSPTASNETVPSKPAGSADQPVANLGRETVAGDEGKPGSAVPGVKQPGTFAKDDPVVFTANVQKPKGDGTSQIVKAGTKAFVEHSNPGDNFARVRLQDGTKISVWKSKLDHAQEETPSTVQAGPATRAVGIQPDSDGRTTDQHQLPEKSEWQSLFEQASKAQPHNVASLRKMSGEQLRKEIENGNSGRGSVSSINGGGGNPTNEIAHEVRDVPIRERGTAGISANRPANEAGNIGPSGESRVIHIGEGTPENPGRAASVTSVSPEGEPKTVRLYRGEIVPGSGKGVPDWIKGNDQFRKSQQAEGRWFSSDRAEAQKYAADAGTGRLVYIDVPADEAEKYEAHKHPEASKFVHATKPGKTDEYFVPRELAAKAQAHVEPGVSPEGEQAAPRLASDIEKWQPPPELGAFSAPDHGAAARAQTERRMGGPLTRSSAEVAPGKVGEMKTSDLKVAPHKFQYKLSTDAEGVGTLLKDTKVFNPDLAGVISVWRDPADGKTYVVNGHHRYELAKRTGQKAVTVRHIIAKDAVTARAIGALQNIAEGRGTAIDAAKFFHDSGLTPEQLKDKGISLGEKTASDGLAMSRLDQSIFAKVVSGDLRQGRAVAIGEATADPAEQKAILSLVEKKERSGAKVSDDTLSELIRLVKGAEQTTETTANLFGSQEISRSLALEKSEISAHVKQQLAKDKKLFGFVSKGDRATELQRGGNKIDVEKSKEISTSAAQAEEVYNKLSARGGPIASILDEAARKLADGENAGEVKSDAYSRIRKEIAQTLGGTEGASPERSKGTPETSNPASDDSVSLFSPREPSKPSGLIDPRSTAKVSFEVKNQSSSLPSYLRVNNEGMELLHRVEGVQFEGVNLDYDNANNYVRHLEAIADSLAERGQGSAETAVRGLAEAMRNNNDRNDGLTIVNQSDSPEHEMRVLREELMHAGAQRRPGLGEVNRGIPWREVIHDPIFSDRMDDIEAHYERQGHKTTTAGLVAEAAVDFMTGEGFNSPEENAQALKAYFGAASDEMLSATKDIFDFIDQEARSKGIVKSGEQFDGERTKPAREALASAIDKRSARPSGGTDAKRNEGVPERTGRREVENSKAPRPTDGGGGPLARAGSGSVTAATPALHSTSPVGLTDEELDTWAKSKGFRAEPAGEQLGMFSAPDPIVRVFRAGPKGEQKGLAYQSQLDKVNAPKPEEPLEPFALTGGDVPPDNQPRLFGAGDLGEIIGPGKSKPSTNSTDEPFSLFRSEKGEAEPGKIGEAVGNAAGHLGEFLRSEAADTRKAKDLQWDLYDLDNRHEGRVHRAKQEFKRMKKAGVTQEDRKAIDEHLDALQANSEHIPIPSLTPHQDQILDDILMPMRAEAEAAYRKVNEGGMLIPNYNPRQTKGRGGMLDRFLTPKAEKRTGKGNTLSQANPATKHRSMMALEAQDGAGERRVVSIKGNQVTALENGQGEHLGALSSGMTKNLDILSKQLDPLVKRMGDLREQIAAVPHEDKQDRVEAINDRIKDLQKEREAARKAQASELGKQVGEKSVYGNRESRAITERIAALEKERADISASGHMSNAGEARVRRLKANLAEVEGQRDSILEQVPTDELLDKVWIDKNGKRWKIGQATKNEIEANSDVKYYHDAAASTIVNWLQAKKAEAAFDFMENLKNDPEFSKVGMKTDQGNPPVGWRTVNLPQLKGYYFEPHTAEVLDWFNDRLKSGSPNAFDSINGYMRAKILLNPIKHPLNVGAQWAVEKGVTGFLPHKWMTIGRTGAKAINAVVNQNQDFLDALDAGGPLQSARSAGRDLVKTFYDQMADGAEKGEPWATKLAKSIGLAPVELVKLLHHMASKVAWPASDMMFLQAAYQYQAEHPGVELHAALREVGRIIPEYRLPTRIFDSPTMAKIMGSPVGTMFGSYHYGVLRSFTESAKSALGMGEAPNTKPGGEAGRGRVADVAKGWDRLAMMALGAFAIYPALHALARKMTGDKDAEVAGHGIFGYLNAAAKVAKREETVTQGLTKVVTPNQLSEDLLGLGLNINLKTGHHIRDNAAAWGIQGTQLMDFIKDEGVPLGSDIHRASTQPEGWKKFGFNQLDVNFPKHGAEKLAGDIASDKASIAASSPRDRETYYARQAAIEGLRKGDSKAFEEGLESGKIRPDEVNSLMRRSQGSPLYDKVHGFSYDETLRVYNKAVDTNDVEAQQELLPLLMEKMTREMSKGHEVEQPEQVAQ